MAGNRPADPIDNPFAEDRKIGGANGDGRSGYQPEFRVELYEVPHDEWTYLREAAESSPELAGLSGENRVTLYMLAIQTGLGVNELASLTPGKVVLGSKSPHVLCRAAGTKNKKPAKQYIDKELAERLNHLCGRTAKGTRLFEFQDQNRIADVLRTDLARARQQWIEAATDPQERQKRTEDDFLSAINAEKSLDFHALRHTTGAWLAIAGIHPKVIQSVMRHGTITLTMDRYMHLFPGEEEGAVDSIAAVMRGTIVPRSQQRLKAS